MTSTSDSSTSSYRIRSVLWPSEPRRGPRKLLRMLRVPLPLVYTGDPALPQLAPDKSLNLEAGTPFLPFTRPLASHISSWGLGLPMQWGQKPSYSQHKMAWEVGHVGFL